MKEESNLFRAVKPVCNHLRLRFLSENQRIYWHIYCFFLGMRNRFNPLKNILALALLAFTVGTQKSAAQSFAPAMPLMVGANPYCVAVADVNGDGKVDLVTANSGTNTSTVLTN